MQNISSDDPSEFEKALDNILSQPNKINNDLILTISQNFTIPTNSGISALNKVNNIKHQALNALSTR